MKNTLLFIALFFANLNFAQNVNIPDTNFKNALLAHGVTITSYGVSKIDTNDDGEIQVTEATAYTGTIDVGTKKISSLTGIEAFVNVKILICNNNQLTSLDVSQNTSLKNLNCDDNQITNLNLSQNNVLIALYCTDNQLSSLDVTQSINLNVLNCTNNQLSSLDVTQNTNLNILNCTNNQLSSLDVTQNTNLNILNCTYNQLSSLDVTQNSELENIYCANNQLTSIDVTQNAQLTVLECYYNQLTSLDVSQNAQLTVLQCSGNQLTSLDVTQNSGLIRLYCSLNQLTSLDLTQNTALKYFACFTTQLTSLNVANGNNNNIISFTAYSNPYLTCIQIDNGFTPPSSGWYKDATASYSTNCALSTDNFELSKQFTVYPNPVNTILNIQNEEGIAVKNYIVLDVNGRVLMKPSQEIQNNQINLTGLTPGIYFIQLETDKGLAIKRIVKE